LIGGAKETPSDTDSQYDILTNGRLVASHSVPLNFVYNNATDVAQTGTRTLEIIVKRLPEGVF